MQQFARKNRARKLHVEVDPEQSTAMAEILKQYNPIVERDIGVVDWYETKYIVEVPIN